MEYFQALFLYIGTQKMKDTVEIVLFKLRMDFFLFINQHAFIESFALCQQDAVGSKYKHEKKCCPSGANC